MELQTFGLHLLLLTLCLVGLGHAQEEVPKPSNKTGKAGRAISVFQVVRFPNDACTGTTTGGKNGTCYTAAECSAQGGTNAGSCAAGYGVCCTFSLKCGGVATQNCSYFESTGTEIGQCAIKVCKCSSNICQIRLDFNTFSITGPSTSATSVTMLANGQSTASPIVANFQKYTPATECLTDLFTVTNPGGAAPPTICGTNTGQHMYVDANDLCNTLGFELSNAVSTTGAATAISTRSWSIKITQYDCSYNNLAPEGCTQFYYGATSQCVTSYNYNNANGVQLANQNQNICVRKERDFCRICWTTTGATTDFQISGTANGGVVVPSKCCGYGASAAGTLKTAAGVGYDCVTIPGASKVTAIAGAPFGVPLTVSRFCGKTSLKSGAPAGNKSICSTRQPFQLRFLSDNGELLAEAATAINKGFRLCYIESNTNC